MGFTVGLKSSVVQTFTTHNYHFCLLLLHRLLTFVKMMFAGTHESKNLRWCLTRLSKIFMWISITPVPEKPKITGLNDYRHADVKCVYRIEVDHFNKHPKIIS